MVLQPPYVGSFDPQDSSILLAHPGLKPSEYDIQGVEAELGSANIAQPRSKRLAEQACLRNA